MEIKTNRYQALGDLHIEVTIGFDSIEDLKFLREELSGRFGKHTNTEDNIKLVKWIRKIDKALKDA